ncbi:MAG: amidohydrolase family protein [Acidobacteria bacterium]|nr:amidohydrolase family protein [Acidobacteriota bacterium]
MPHAVAAEREQTAQVPDGATIEYIAHAAFRITSSAGDSVLIDPYASRVWIGYDYPAGITADAILISHPHYDHDGGVYRGGEPPWAPDAQVFRDPGEYQVGSIRVVGVRGKHADPYGEEFGQINTIWLVEVDGMRIVHTGDNGPIDDTVEAALGRVDLLMLPIDAEFHILSQADIDDTRRRLSPRYTIPMHFRADRLEPDPNGPGDLGNATDWADGRDDVIFARTDTVTLAADDLPLLPRYLVLNIRTDLLPPAYVNDLTIANVSVVDAVRGVRHAMDVSISDRKIVAVRRHRGEIADDAIDGTGKFLIPGLWDAHVHFDYEPELAPAMFDLFLANGITSVRDTGGQLEAVMPWKHHASSGEVPAPNVYVAGPLVDGVPRVYDGSAPFRPNLGVGVATADEAVAMVDALVDAGVDLLKAYELLTPEAFAAVVERAHFHGKRVTGHPPLSMDTAEAAARLDSVEHLRNLELACSDEAEVLLSERRAMLAAGAENGGTLRSSIHAAQRGRAVSTFSESRCDSVARSLAEAGSWQVPTLTIVMPRVNRLYARDGWRDTFRHLPEPVRSTWTQGALGMVDDQPDQATVAHGDWVRGMVKRLADADVPLMAGTDTPIFFLTPGFSLHEELANLVDAGLTPMQALDAATIAPARYFRIESTTGSIAPGKTADLVLLGADPLQNIRNTSSIEAVIRGGELFDRAALDQMLARAAEAS